MTSRWLLLIPLLLLLSACGTLSRPGGYYEDDGPETSPPADIANIPDAVPKDEPRSASGNNPYSVYGVTYTPLADTGGYRERGVASWYGKKFHGKRTSSGEPYDMYAMTAAHKTLPLPSYVRVRNLQNDRSVVVRVNDRGPFLHNRLIDLSYAAAARLGILGTGTGVVEIEAVGPGEPATQVVKTYPLQIIPPAAAAEEISVAPAPAANPKLYLQVGAFAQRENAVSLRDRLEREALRPIFVQSSQTSGGTDAAPVYRVRIGPLASVEEGDRLTERAAQLGIRDARIVVE
ncbi:rare lipoprotein A [Sulfuricaulis limicola]|uniref:Endolytic peptidoglycan transglycosylase RlpA n=1 Tax=Sulfuricaulis limicola TaxID=1620215 RepID=A0A1B4XCJ1_9GAMM|nr:septal ring lytic transglycosylase RlpA family protein [Sulfuricaulis limicola]BAV32528.1 rare lipoprotein A [Sulfuricaulis limicola]